MSRPNIIYGWFSYLASNYLAPVHMRSNLPIHSGCTMQSGRSILVGATQPNKPLATMSDTEQKGDLLNQLPVLKGGGIHYEHESRE